jgi:multiple antibiotic resistance protein
MILDIRAFEPSLILQIFVLLNPFSSLPILMAAYKQKINAKKIALSSTGIAFIIAVLMVFIGPPLLSLFGITMDSFRMAGGLVLLLLGVNTILLEEKPSKQVNKSDTLVSIIATPLLTGPATISFITIKASEMGRLGLLSNLVFAFLLVGIVFFLFSVLIKHVNLKFVSITSKVLGLFLVGLAIEMIGTGIMNFVKAS